MHEVNNASRKLDELTRSHAVCRSLSGGPWQNLAESGSLSD